MKNTENTEQTPLTPLVRGGQNYFPLIRGIEGVCTKAFTLVELIVVITILAVL
jgi:prepilin-type N-terminal cleavage/methylation domain-containing protein